MHHLSALCSWRGCGRLLRTGFPCLLIRLPTPALDKLLDIGSYNSPLRPGSSGLADVHSRLPRKLLCVRACLDAVACRATGVTEKIQGFKGSDYSVRGGRFEADLPLKNGRKVLRGKGWIPALHPTLEAGMSF